MKVFGMLERQGRIFTTVVDDVSAETLMAEIQQHSEKGSVFYPDRFKSYKSLKFCGKHLMVNHGIEFAKGRRHINGLEGFSRRDPCGMVLRQGKAVEVSWCQSKSLLPIPERNGVQVQLQKSKSLSTVEQNPLWTGF